MVDLCWNTNQPYGRSVLVMDTVWSDITPCKQVSNQNWVIATDLHFHFSKIEATPNSWLKCTRYLVILSQNLTQADVFLICGHKAVWASTSVFGIGYRSGLCVVIQEIANVNLGIKLITCLFKCSACVLQQVKFWTFHKIKIWDMFHWSHRSMASCFFTAHLLLCIFIEPYKCYC